MKHGYLYTVTNGKYQDKYLAIQVAYTNSFTLRRVRQPKTKIDAIRLPETIYITEFGANTTINLK